MATSPNKSRNEELEVSEMGKPENHQGKLKMSDFEDLRALWTRVFRMSREQREDLFQPIKWEFMTLVMHENGEGERIENQENGRKLAENCSTGIRKCTIQWLEILELLWEVEVWKRGKFEEKMGKGDREEYADLMSWRDARDRLLRRGQWEAEDEHSSETQGMSAMENLEKWAYASMAMTQGPCQEKDEAGGESGSEGEESQGDEESQEDHEEDIPDASEIDLDEFERWDFQTTRATDEGAMSIRAVPSKKRKWPEFREVLKEARTVSELKVDMSVSILPQRDRPIPQATDLKPEMGNFITTRPQKLMHGAKNPHKKPPTQAQRELMFPPIDPSSIPEEKRLDVLEVLKIGRDIVVAPRKKKGEAFGKTAGYLRHCAAPYAYTYRGHLRQPYWQYRKSLDKNGDEILSEERARILCLGMEDTHEDLPYTINSKGKVYQRAPKDFFPSRDMNGKFVPRPAGVSPVMHTFSQVQGLAAAIEGVSGEFDLRKITGKELGMKRIQAVRKEVLNLAAQTVVDQGRALRAQQQVPALVQREARRLVKKAMEERDSEIKKLKDRIRDNVHQSQKEMEELVSSFEEIIEQEAVENIRLGNENQMLRAQTGMADRVNELA